MQVQENYLPVTHSMLAFQEFSLNPYRGDQEQFHGEASVPLSPDLLLSLAKANLSIKKLS